MTGRKVFMRKNAALPSLESLFGWYSQYERVVRWRERLRSDGSLDILITFFLHCYALRDWLAHSSEVRQREIDAAIKNDFSMSLCRDLCNRSKHLVLLKKASIDANFSIAREYRGKIRPPSVVVMAGGRKIDLLEVVDNCLAFWKDFLGSRGMLDSEALLPPERP